MDVYGFNDMTQPKTIEHGVKSDVFQSPMSQPQKAPPQMGFPEPTSDDPFVLMDQLQ